MLGCAGTVTVRSVYGKDADQDVTRYSAPTGLLNEYEMAA